MICRTTTLVHRGPCTNFGSFLADHNIKPLRPEYVIPAPPPTAEKSTANTLSNG